MPKQDWCAACCANVINAHGRFNGTKGLRPAVTTVRGTRYCGIHGEQVLRKVQIAEEMGRDHAPLSTIAAVLDSPALDWTDIHLGEGTISKAENFEARR